MYLLLYIFIQNIQKRFLCFFKDKLLFKKIIDYNNFNLLIKQLGYL